MIVITLKDAPMGSYTWRVMFGPGVIWGSEHLAPNQYAILPIEKFDEPYRSGIFDWLFMFFYGSGGNLLEERWWRNEIRLQDGIRYEYSYLDDSFTPKGNALETVIFENMYTFAGLAAAGMVIGWGWKGIQGKKEKKQGER